MTEKQAQQTTSLLCFPPAHFFSPLLLTLTHVKNRMDAFFLPSSLLCLHVPPFPPPVLLSSCVCCCFAVSSLLCPFALLKTHAKLNSPPPYFNSPLFCPSFPSTHAMISSIYFTKNCLCCCFCLCSLLEQKKYRSRF
ncbi:hypothetical protein K457DRAFT_290291 [Linnemannia elongata AG-77]|uniref:Uncharacterized protein n=1 Tax=Linnemannia elongata AG-77 TaxID=1314771 RepID=A0A197K7I2_9FUNG|nr:hypothetical protein K457DRAFT_290291 [Linnemannia elongata AG-77]